MLDGCHPRLTWAGCTGRRLSRVPGVIPRMKPHISCCITVLAYLVAALSPNMEVANAALPTYVVTLLFFAGFLLRWKCAALTRDPAWPSCAVCSTASAL